MPGSVNLLTVFVYSPDHATQTGWSNGLLWSSATSILAGHLFCDFGEFNHEFHELTRMSLLRLSYRNEHNVRNEQMVISFTLRQLFRSSGKGFHWNGIPSAASELKRRIYNAEMHYSHNRAQHVQLPASPFPLGRSAGGT